MLRGLLFGHGHMGRLHARKLALRGDVELLIVDPAQGRPAPAHLKADFAIVASPTSTHLSVALPLLEAGIPTLVEKPLASTAEEAARLAPFPHLMVGHIERFNPALDPVRHVRPAFLQAERLAPFPARGADVDVLADLMVHDLDLLGLLLPGPVGDLRAVGVGVLTGGVDIAQVRIEKGAGVATLTASRVSREPVRTLRLIEPGLYWSVDLHGRSVTAVRWGEGALSGEPVAVPAGDALERELDAFLAAVRGEGPWRCTGQEGLAAIALVEQVRAALSRVGSSR